MSEAGAPSGRPLRVLVVDDKVEHVVTTKLLLLHAGFEVSLAFRGRDVFAEVGRFKPEAILLDIGLPELSGYEIARDLRIAHPHMLIVAVTAYGTQTDRMLAVMAGFDHHLTKPYDPLALVSLLERHAERLARGEAAKPWPLEPGLGRKQDGPPGNSM